MNDELKSAIAAELNVDPAELTSDKRLQDLEYWDSVMVLVVMMIISRSVGKEILPEEMIGVRTFGDIEALVAAKMS
jgi:acyl carrier protein